MSSSTMSYDSYSYDIYDMTEFDIEKVLAQLTLLEKVKLVSAADVWHTQEIPRLNIPTLRVSDGPNGVRGTKFFNGVPSGCFPCGTALGATFDKDLLYGAGELMSQEAKAKGVHVILGPTANMQRSPLGGRGFESFSEDPVVSGFSAAAIINGMQNNGIAATLKHYICNDIEDARTSINSIVTERALRELYLLPFQIAVRDSDPKAIMTAYNKVNGEHVSQSKKFLKDILKDEWKWDGTIMSDWFGTYSIREGIENGLDIEMPGPAQIRKVDSLMHEINSREIHIRDLDDRVRGVLKLVKYTAEHSGLPGTQSELPEDDSNNTPETAAKLRQIAQDSIVLLKNENNVLPLKKDEKIAVIGPNAKFAAYCGGGSASLLAYYTSTPYDGIKSKLDYSPEYTIGAVAHKSLPALGEHLKRPDGTKGYVAKFYLEPRGTPNRTLIDELALSTSYVFLADYYNAAVKNALFYVDFEGELTVEESGIYDFGVTVQGSGQLFINDTLVVDNKTKQAPGTAFFSSGTVEEVSSFALKKDEAYKVRIEFGSGPTTVLTNNNFGLESGGGVQFGYAIQVDHNEEIAKACAIAKAHDKVVLCIGLTLEWESEGYDRPDMDLPGFTNDLIREVLKVQPNTIVVNQSGTPVAMPWYKEAPALLQAWFGGNEGGNAIADVLFGDANPSGKLSLSFPLRVQDNPAYLNFKSNNGQVLYGEDVYIGYKYYEKVERDVMFPFGFGLSYSSFDLTNLSIKQSAEELKVKVNVTNTSKIDGAEVIQVYVAPHNPSITRPFKELKDFTKIAVKAGETGIATVDVNLKYATSFYHEYQEAWCSEKGQYDVLVGTSSDDIVLKQVITIEETQFWTGV